MSAGDDGIKVRATCAAGHETVTTAPKGRVTWRGECHTDGCSHRIVARKVLDDPAEPSTPAPSDPPKPAKKIRKVAAYRGSGPKPDDQQTAPGFDGKPPAGGGGGGGGGPSGVPDDGAGGGAGGPGSGLIDDATPRRGVLQRARQRARDRAAKRAAEGDDKPWTIPGIYR